MWIVVWQEYFINENEQKKELGYELQQLLIETMLALISKFPNLKIIAGANLFEKSCSNPNKITKIESRFNQYNNFIDKEKNIEDKKRQFINIALENIQTIKKNVPPIFYVRQTRCYLFYDNKVSHQDKNLPAMAEVKNENTELKYTVFKPPKKNKKCVQYLILSILILKNLLASLLKYVEIMLYL